MLSKEQILAALNTWVRQRPGLEFGNYGEHKAYNAELRSITKDLKHARELMRAVEWRDSITAEQILAAFPRAYSGRLQISEENGKARLNYTTGQYWPTEYRRAACAVLASVLWDHVREHCMPEPKGKVTRASGAGSFTRETEHDSIEGLSPGDWLRRYFRREFGRGIASRWFD